MRGLLLGLALLALAPGAAAADPGFCLALRGNGYKVPVTLGALARLSEEFGVAGLVLGSSSGSIAAFLYENILLNPAIGDCAGAPCPPQVLGARVSLSLKSMLGFTDFLRASRSGGIVDDVEARLAAGDGPGIGAVGAILSDAPLRGLINGQALLPSRAVFYPQNWRRHAARLRGAAGAANFGATVSFESLLREGLLDLDHAIRLVGRAGDFYSNSGPDLSAQWSKFYGDCTGTQIATGWPGIAARPAGPPGSTCGTLLHDMIETFLARAGPRAPNTRQSTSRRRGSHRPGPGEPLSLQRSVGATHPILVTASFVTGEAVHQSFIRDKRRYDLFQPVDFGPRDWQDEFRIAYFGQDDVLARLSENRMGFKDLKTRRFQAAGPVTWRDAMVRSIGEPGLQAARPYRAPDGTVGITAGGWVDNFGTRPLKNLGCGQVVFVTRQGTDFRFAGGVARALGAGDGFIERLFAQTAGGAFGAALDAADGIVCTDWDRFEGPLNSPEQMAAHGYQSALVTRSPWLLEHASAHLPIRRDHDTPGCRPPAR